MLTKSIRAPRCTSLKDGGGDKQPDCCSQCGGHKDDPGDTGHLVTDRMIAEYPE